MYIKSRARTRRVGLAARLPLPGIRRKVLALRYHREMCFFFTTQASLSLALSFSRALTIARALSRSLSLALHVQHVLLCIYPYRFFTTQASFLYYFTFFIFLFKIQELGLRSFMRALCFQIP